MSPPERIKRWLTPRPLHPYLRQANENVAPDGTLTRWENDRLGRVVNPIENANLSPVPAVYKRRTDAPRITLYTYAPRICESIR